MAEVLLWRMKKKKSFRWTAEFYSCRWVAGPGFALFAVFAGLVTVCLSRLGLGHLRRMSRLTIERMRDKSHDSDGVKAKDEALMAYLFFPKQLETDNPTS